jgi:hypothetical protein
MQATTHAPASGALPFAAGAVDNTPVTEREPVARCAKFFGA